MKKEIKNVGLSDGGILHVFCFDSVNLKDRTTFDSCMVKDIQVTYWMDDEGDAKERLNGMFNILFEEVMKNRSKNLESGT